MLIVFSSNQSKINYTFLTNKSVLIRGIFLYFIRRMHNVGEANDIDSVRLFYIKTFFFYLS